MGWSGVLVVAVLIRGYLHGCHRIGETVSKLDKATLEILLREAIKQFNASENKLQKYDNSDDLRAAQNWEHTAYWLRSKLEAGRGKP